MNERIKQIAEQAGVAVWGDAVYMYNPKDNLNSAVLEKFALLIVAECSKVIHDLTPIDYMEMDTMHRIRDSVKEHFGVE